MIKKKGWVLMAIARRRYKGKWQYRYQTGYYTANGVYERKSSKWFNSAQEAKLEEKKFKARSKTNGIKFLTVAEEYIRSSMQENVKKTSSRKIFYLNNLFEPLQLKNIDQITAVMIRDLFDNSEYFQSLSTSSKNRARSFINSVFLYAEEFYDLEKNPMRVIPRFKKTDEEKLRKMNIYTPNQFKAFLDVIPADKWIYRDLFYVLYWTGMRLNECNSLTFNDISPKKIDLYRQFKDGKWTVLKTDGSKRKIAIDKDLYSVFESLELHYKDYPGFSKEWFCFGGYRQLPYTSIERVKNNAVKDSGLPKIRIHDFRHSHASNLIEAGVNIYKISKRLGHSSIGITLDRYGHLIDEDGDEILNAISKK